jgi:hypothetical protein
LTTDKDELAKYGEEVLIKNSYMGLLFANSFRDIKWDEDLDLKTDLYTVARDPNM